MKNYPVSVMFPKDLLKKIDENEFTKFYSRADFVRTVVNDFFRREEKAREDKNNNEKTKE